MIPRHTRMRLFSACLTAAAVAWTGGHEPQSVPWDTFVYTLAFAHYFISLFFSQDKIKQAASCPDSIWKLAGLSLVGIFFYYRQAFPLIIYFGLHHAFNETYLLDRVTRYNDVPVVRSLRSSSVCVHFIVFMFLIRSQLYLISANLTFGKAPVIWLFISVVVAYGIFFLRLAQSWGHLNASERVDNCAGEFLLIIAIAASFYMPFKSHYIVAYHFIFWVLYPLPRLALSGSAFTWRYLGLNGLMLGLFYAVSPMGSVPYAMTETLFRKQFVFWSYFHITASLALSNYHPRWIVRFFRPHAGSVRVT